MAHPLRHDLPFRSEDEKRQFFSLVGHIAISWGLAEANLVSIVLSVRHPLNNPLPGETGVPVSFGKKVDAIKAGFRDLPPLHPERDRARLLLARAKTLHRKRSEVVHGICQGSAIDGSLMLDFQHIDGGRVTWRSHRYSPDDLRQIAEDIDWLEEELRGLAKNVRLAVIRE